MRCTHFFRAAAVLMPLSLAVFSPSCSNPSTEPAGSGSATTAPATAPSSSIAETVQGSWAGSAHAVVVWVNHTQIDVRLDIAPDGSVTGTVGDATLVDARLRSGRSEIERSLGWGRDYRIHGNLDGDIIKAEGIHRDGVDIVFDRRDENTLVGGLSSTGTEFGGKESMRLAAQHLTLKRLANK
jgi:hypothetical protein